MSTLDRYILQTFARNLALVLVTLLSLYGLIEFLEKVDNLIEHQAGLKYYLLYPFYNLPVMISNSLPMAVLLATFATIGGFSRTNQLTAMLSGGLSYSRISRSLFLGGLVLAALILVANLWLVPWSSRESNYLLRTEIAGKPSHSETGKDIYFRDGNRMISVSEAFPAKGIVLDLTVLEFNEQFIPTRRIQAEKALHEKNGQWLLMNVAIWDFSPETRAVGAFEKQSELRLDLKRQPTEMLQLWDRPEDLTFSELRALTVKLQDEGYDSKPYQMETQLRFARAAIPLIMVLVGIPFALQRGRNASFSFGVVISLIIFAAYFVLDAIFAVFGAIAVLPPPVAAWAASILLALIGTWLILRIQS